MFHTNYLGYLYIEHWCWFFPFFFFSFQILYVITEPNLAHMLFMQKAHCSQLIYTVLCKHELEKFTGSKITFTYWPQCTAEHAWMWFTKVWQHSVGITWNLSFKGTYIVMIAHGHKGPDFCSSLLAWPASSKFQVSNIP